MVSGVVERIGRWRDVFMVPRAVPGLSGPGEPGQPGSQRSAVDTATLAIALLIALLVVIDQVTRR